MIVKVKGTISAVGQKKSGVSQSGNQWASQDFVVKDERENIVCMNVFGEEHIKKFAVGQNIEVDAILSAREWNGRYFNSLSYYAPREEYTSATPTQQVAPQQAQAATSNSNDSDFPF